MRDKIPLSALAKFIFRQIISCISIRAAIIIARERVSRRAAIIAIDNYLMIRVRMPREMWDDPLSILSIFERKMRSAFRPDTRGKSANSFHVPWKTRNPQGTPEVSLGGVHATFFMRLFPFPAEARQEE